MGVEPFEQGPGHVQRHGKRPALRDRCAGRGGRRRRRGSGRPRRSCRRAGGVQAEHVADGRARPRCGHLRRRRPEPEPLGDLACGGRGDGGDVRQRPSQGRLRLEGHRHARAACSSAVRRSTSRARVVPGITHEPEDGVGQALDEHGVGGRRARRDRSGHSAGRRRVEANAGLPQACAVAGLPGPRSGLREPGHEPTLEATARVPHQLDGVGGVSEHLQRLQAREVVEEPAARREHAQGVPLHLQQLDGAVGLRVAQRPAPRARSTKRRRAGAPRSKTAP